VTSQFDAIEERARSYLDDGWQPTDSEPGEWLELTDPVTGEVVVIESED
jgi:hypothetical protein